MPSPQSQLRQQDTAHIGLDGGVAGCTSLGDLTPVEYETRIHTTGLLTRPGRAVRRTGHSTHAAERGSTSGCEGD